MIIINYLLFFFMSFKKGKGDQSQRDPLLPFKSGINFFSCSSLLLPIYNLIEIPKFMDLLVCWQIIKIEGIGCRQPELTSSHHAAFTFKQGFTSKINTWILYYF